MRKNLYGFISNCMSNQKSSDRNGFDSRRFHFFVPFFLLDLFLDWFLWIKSCMSNCMTLFGACLVSVLAEFKTRF